MDYLQIEDGSLEVLLRKDPIISVTPVSPLPPTPNKPFEAKVAKPHIKKLAKRLFTGPQEDLEFRPFKRNPYGKVPTRPRKPTTAPKRKLLIETSLQEQQFSSVQRANPSYDTPDHIKELLEGSPETLRTLQQYDVPRSKVLAAQKYFLFSTGPSSHFKFTRTKQGTFKVIIKLPNGTVSDNGTFSNSRIPIKVEAAH